MWSSLVYGETKGCDTISFALPKLVPSVSQSWSTYVHVKNSCPNRIEFRVQNNDFQVSIPNGRTQSSVSGHLYVDFVLTYTDIMSLYHFLLAEMY